MSNGARLGVYLMRILNFEKNNLFFFSLAGAHGGTKLANLAVKIHFTIFHSRQSLRDL